MPFDATIKDDGIPNFGSPTITINSVAYIANNISIERPTNTVERTDGNGRPIGQRTEPSFVTGSAELQLETGSTERPKGSDEFTYDTGRDEEGVETFYITDVSDAYTKGEEQVVSITFRKKINVS